MFCEEYCLHKGAGNMVRNITRVSLFQGRTNEKQRAFTLDWGLMLCCYLCDGLGDVRQVQRWHALECLGGVGGLLDLLEGVRVGHNTLQLRKGSGKRTIIAEGGRLM